MSVGKTEPAIKRCAKPKGATSRDIGDCKFCLDDGQSGLMSTGVHETPQNRRERFWYIFGNETRTEFARCGTMQPNRGAGRLERRHGLRQQPAHESGQHVAGASGRKPWRRIAGDRRTSIRARDHAVRALENDHGAEQRRSGAGAFELGTENVRAAACG